MEKRIKPKRKNSKVIHPQEKGVMGKRIAYKESPRTVIFCLIILAIIIFFTPFGFGFLLFFAAIVSSELFDTPLLFANSLVVFVIVAAAFIIAKKRPESSTKTIIISASCIILLFLIASPSATIPIYRSYITARAPMEIKSYLEKRYGESFVVENPKYYSGVALGDGHGVSVDAYPINDPALRFGYSLDTRDSYQKSRVYEEKYSAKYEALYKSTLAKEVNRTLENQAAVTIGVFYDEYAASRSDAKPIFDTLINVSFDQPFNDRDWVKHKGNIVKVAEILESSPQYKNITLHYTVEKSGSKGHVPTKLMCSSSPGERINRSVIEQKADDCLDLHHRTTVPNKEG